VERGGGVEGWYRVRGAMGESLRDGWLAGRRGNAGKWDVNENEWGNE